MEIKNKIKKREWLAKKCQEWKKEGKAVGFTSGSFDIIHDGHALYMEEAKKKCDILIVGINSDKSVQMYKGPDRPIIPEKSRINLIAAFEPVDYVFKFEERRNKENIQALKPNLYIKAGDYKMSTLTSKEIVEKYGGKALILPLVEGVSTSNIIKKILKVYGKSEGDVVEKDKATYIKDKKTKKCQAVFLDRDGVINEDLNYIGEVERYKLYPNSIKALKKLMDMELKLIIITNQPGIGIGYFSKEDFYKVNLEMFKQLSKHGIMIDKVYFCPHSKSENCECRKPKTKMVERAVEDLNVDLSRSYFIGDKTSDIKCGENVGTKNILLKIGKAGKDKEYKIKPDYVADDLLDAANWILKEERK